MSPQVRCFMGTSVGEVALREQVIRLPSRRDSRAVCARSCSLLQHPGYTQNPSMSAIA